MDKTIYAVTYSNWDEYDLMGGMLFENREDAEIYLTSLPKRVYSYDIEEFILKGKDAN